MNQLTIEQLKSLEVGEWIWCVHIGDPICNEYLQKSCVSDGERFGIMNLPYGDHLDYSDYGTKWVAYKNKQEAETKGEIVELPCKRGDIVWVVEKEFDGWNHYWDYYSTAFELELYERWGDTVFATEEEAERRLAELTKE